MAVFNVTTRDFRAKQAEILSKVDSGEKVFLHRGKDKVYAITPVHNKVKISDELKKDIEKARQEFREEKCISCKTFEESLSLFETL